MNENVPGKSVEVEVSDFARFQRNRNLIDQKRLNKIAVVGLGAVGSELIAQLTIMGWNKIIAFDEDILEQHNLSSTKYFQEFTSQLKTHAARQMAHRYNPKVSIETRPFFVKGSPVYPIMIVCTDTMKSRKIVYNEWYKQPERRLFIDVRMDSLTMQVITTTMTEDKWIDYWHLDRDIKDADCTMKHTIFTSALAAGHTVKQLFLVLMGLPYYQYEWHGFSPTAITTENLLIDEISLALNEKEGVKCDTQKNETDKASNEGIPIQEQPEIPTARPSVTEASDSSPGY